MAGKLHTGRSRNDQIALDLRLYLRRAALDRIAQLEELVGVLAAKAAEVGATVVASYTHLQQAQAVPLAHHLLAYAWMLRRDEARFSDALPRIDVSPLGAGAGGGSSLPLDPEIAAAEMGFGAVFDNSMDAVASRDFAAEYSFCCAQAMVHLSRLAEDLILWATEEFGWVDFADSYTTGSSALPHKKNPDVAELARGKAATVIGDVTSLLALQKGLPLTYNRDLQEDKAAVFHADDTLAGALEAIAGMVATATFDPPRPSPWVAALGLAETLAGRGVPFREAHHAVGSLVAHLTEQERTLSDVTGPELVAAHDAFVVGDADQASQVGVVAASGSAGGGSAESVAAQLRRLVPG